MTFKFNVWPRNPGQYAESVDWPCTQASPHVSMLHAEKSGRPG